MALIVSAFFCCLFLVRAIACSETKPETDDALLHAFLLQKCPFLRSHVTIPIEADDILNVNVSMRLYRFLALDDLDQKLSLVGEFVMKWRNPCCTWSAADEGTRVKAMAKNLTYAAARQEFTFFDRKKIWHPLIGHTNSVDDMFIVINHAWPSIKVSQDSLLEWTTNARFESYCNLNFKKFPFDVQVCPLTFMMWMYPAEMARFQDTVVAFENYEEFIDRTEIWHLDDHWSRAGLELSLGVNRSVLRYTFSFRRKHQFYVTSIFLPIGLLIMVQLSVLAVPARATDRPVVSVAAVLAFGVLQTDIQENIPKTSQLVYLVVYVNGHFLLSILITTYILVACELARQERFTAKSAFFKMAKIRLCDAAAFVIGFLLVLFMNGVAFSLMLSSD